MIHGLKTVTFFYAILKSEGNIHPQNLRSILGFLPRACSVMPVSIQVSCLTQIWILEFLENLWEEGERRRCQLGHL